MLLRQVGTPGLGRFGDRTVGPQVVPSPSRPRFGVSPEHHQHLSVI